MSDYLSHFLGYVFQIFKKENSIKKISSPVGNVARKCSSVIENREFKKKIEKIAGDLSTSKCSLKRVHSCPHLDQEYIIHTKDGPRCRTCTDKLAPAQHTPKNKQVYKQNKPKEIIFKDPWNSVRPEKTFSNNSILRRFRSLNLQSLDDDNLFENVKTHLKSAYHSGMGAGDGKYIESNKLESCKLNLAEEVRDQYEVKISRVEKISQSEFVPESSITKDAPRIELLTSDDYGLNSKTFQESCYFDVATDMQQKADLGDQISQLETPDESTHEYFEHLTPSENSNGESSRTEFYNRIKESEIFLTPFQGNTLSFSEKDEESIESTDEE